MGAGYVKGTPDNLESVQSLQEAELWFDEVTRELSVELYWRIRRNQITEEERVNSPKLAAARAARDKEQEFR